MQHLNFEAIEAVLFEIKIFGHAALDDAIAFDPIFEGQSTQIAIELVGPLVIGAYKTALIAMGLLTKPHAAVSAAVFNHANTVIDAFL